jgi:uncharacterized membrane protein YkgB
MRDRFWLRFAGLAVLIGIILMIVLLFVSRAIYAFGFLGGFLAFAAVLVLVSWLFDRRATREEKY